MPFSSKTKTYVGLTTVPLIPEQTMFNESVLGAVFSNTSIAQSLSAELRNGWIGKANTFYRQAKSSFPTSGKAVFTSVNQGDTLNPLLSNILNEVIVIHATNTANYDVTYTAYQYLIDNYDFRPQSNIVYGLVEGAIAIFQEAGIRENTMVLTFMDVNGELFEEVIEDYEVYSGEYLHVLYSLEAAPTQGLVFLYKLDSNEYPELNAGSTTSNYNDYFPVVIVRKDKVNTVDQTTEYSTKAKKLLKRVGLDLGHLTDQIMTNEEGQSDVIDDCFVTFSLNIQDKYPGSIRYLYEYFYRISLDSANSKNDFLNWVNYNSPIKPQFFITYTEDTFNSRIDWDYITYTVKSGVLPNKVERETILIDTPLDSYSVRTEEKSKLVLRKQLTSDTYGEVVIQDLRHITSILTGHNVIRYLEDSVNEPTNEDESDSGFYIPLSKTVVDRLPMIARKQVLYASFILPIYTVQRVKIKWYQTGAFRALLVIAAIVWTVITAGADGGTALEIAITLATQIITAIIIGEILKVAIDVLGIENAFIIAVIMTAVALYNGGFDTNGLPWAQELLQLSLLSFNSIGAVINDEFVKLQNEMTEFLLTAKEIQEEIDEAEALLNNSKYDFYTLSKGGLYFNPNETPDQYYSRSAYDQNPGVKSFDLLYNYFDRMLMLPEHRYV